MYFNPLDTPDFDDDSDGPDDDEDTDEWEPCDDPGYPVCQGIVVSPASEIS